MRARRYIEAGDVFQVVPSHRFRAPFDLPPFACYRSLRRLNPSPFLFYLELRRLPARRLKPGNPGAAARRQGHHPPHRRHPAVAAPRPSKTLALEKDLLADPKERAEHLMLLDLGRNDVGRVAVMLRHDGANTPTANAQGAQRSGHRKFQAIERYSHVMHIVSNVEGDAPANGVDPVDVLMAALPAGTLSGAP